jgi:hypothetical protein
MYSHPVSCPVPQRPCHLYLLLSCHDVLHASDLLSFHAVQTIIWSRAFQLFSEPDILMWGETAVFLVTYRHSRPSLDYHKQKTALFDNRRGIGGLGTPSAGSWRPVKVFLYCFSVAKSRKQPFFCPNCRLIVFSFSALSAAQSNNTWRGCCNGVGMDTPSPMIAM